MDTNKRTDAGRTLDGPLTLDGGAVADHIRASANPHRPRSGVWLASQAS
jgi:hypothetical protein